MEIVSRKEAKANGLKRYFTGKPCKHGHTSKRNTSTRDCITCSEIKNKEYYWANKAQALKNNAQWVASHLDHRSNYAKDRRVKMGDTLRAQSSAWNKLNPDVVLAANTRYYWRNRETILHKKATSYKSTGYLDAKERYRLNGPSMRAA